MERYGTVGMNYIHLSAYDRSGEGASSRSTDVERDNHSFHRLGEEDQRN